MRVYVYITVFAVVFLIGLSGCSGSMNTTQQEVIPATINPSTSATINPFVSLNIKQAADMVQSNKNNPNFVILDVRTPEEYARGHIDRAINIDLLSPDFQKNLANHDRGNEYLVYCRTGIRSAEASKIMIENGFTAVYNMLGGLNQWIAEGYPVVN
jgi:rhodanese-related sulfurtransferase